MNRRILVTTLIGIGLAGVIGVVGAEVYRSHEQSERVAAQKAVAPPEAVDGPGAATPWAFMRTEMQRMQARMDQAFETAFREAHDGAAGTAVPITRVDIEEQGDHYLVKAELSGARDSDIDVRLDGRLLSIFSRTQGDEEQKADNGQVIRHERYASRFEQAFTLPGPVIATGMQTRFQDGVLTVTIPKATS